MDAHRLVHENLHRWRTLRPGQEILVVKLSPKGVEAARYPATVVAGAPQDDWVALRATWTYQRVEVGGLIFDPGDEVIEWFSPRLPFNAFAVLSPAGELRGWYANVTYPAYLELTREAERSLALVWHDLYLDVVGLPDHSHLTLDEDELAESGLAASAPLLYREIVAAASELTRRFQAHELPFRIIGTVSTPEFAPRQSQNESD